MAMTTFIYLAIAAGIVVAIWGLRTMTSKEQEPPAQNYDDYLDQTCELNYKPEDN